MSTIVRKALPWTMLLAVLAAVSLGVVMSSGSKGNTSIVTSSELGGDFSLRNIDGKVTLSDYQGKVVVVYFGFLSCPEVCPTSMSVLKRSLEILTPSQLEKTQAIMVSIDPQRDGFQDLADFTRYYHDNIIGVTGSVDEIQHIAEQYGAFFEITESESVESAYAYRHSSRYYVINQSGKLVQAMRHSTTPNELAARIKTIFKDAIKDSPA
ncbi:MAG TPA: SCO family protein [Porticoccaceae bacterium]|jgi:protein SCO1/2|nr:SCO family protein [Porticoccaceae bacterium]